MKVLEYHHKQIYKRSGVVKRLMELTNQGWPHDEDGSGLRQDLGAKRNGRFFLAWIAGKIVAWAFVSKARGKLQIGVYVEHPMRRKGIGGKLCKRAKAYAKKKEKEILYDSNTTAGRRMYKGAGFKHGYYDWVH